MPIYTSTEQFYACMGQVIDSIQQHTPAAAAAVSQARVIVRMRLTDPLAEITMNGRLKPVDIRYGPTKMRADLEMQLTADTLHSLLLDELSIKQAVARGMIKVRGPVWKLAPMGRVIEAGRAFYPDVLRNCAQGG